MANEYEINNMKDIKKHTSGQESCLPRVLGIVFIATLVALSVFSGCDNFTPPSTDGQDPTVVVFDTTFTDTVVYNEVVRDTVVYNEMVRDTVVYTYMEVERDTITYTYVDSTVYNFIEQDSAVYDFTYKDSLIVNYQDTTILRETYKDTTIITYKDSTVLSAKYTHMYIFNSQMVWGYDWQHRQVKDSPNYEINSTIATPSDTVTIGYYTVIGEETDSLLSETVIRGPPADTENVFRDTLRTDYAGDYIIAKMKIKWLGEEMVHKRRIDVGVINDINAKEDKKKVDSSGLTNISNTNNKR